LPGFSQSGTQPYFRRDLHWSAKGHHLTAHIIYDQLAAVDFEPKPFLEPVGANGWAGGEVIVDEYEISIDPLAPAGDYQAVDPTF